jgi:hypothetical protein
MARMDAGGIARRVYGDYVQPERLDDLRSLLESALAAGYRTMTLSAFADLINADAGPVGDRVLLLRHDVDSDVPRARRMWELEAGLGMVGTYFFRRSTWDPAFMRELAAAGCEAGYHYEELATLVKEHGVATAVEARALLGAARARLRATIPALRAQSGLALDVLAAHGDFANRAVGVSNVEMLDDRDLRSQIGVRLEAYDIETHVSARAADGERPGQWRPSDPIHAIRQREPVVALLLHPRSWGRAPLANAREDLRRVGEGCAYLVRRARRRRAGPGRVEPAT